MFIRKGSETQRDKNVMLLHLYMFIPQWPHNLKSCDTILVVATRLLRLFITCKPEGSGNFETLPGVIVIWFERDERRLRAEGGREEDRLSVAKHRERFQPSRHRTISHRFRTKNLERRRCRGGRDGGRTARPSPNGKHILKREMRCTTSSTR